MARSPSSRQFAAATPASAERAGGARSPSSSTLVASAPASAELAAPAVFPVACLAPTMTLRLARVGGSSQLGPAWLW